VSAPADLPVPCNIAVADIPPTLLATVSVALSAPLTEGVKVILNLQLRFPASEPVQVVPVAATAKSPALGPLNDGAMPEMVSGL
jgi:hypothetical protein